MIILQVHNFYRQKGGEDMVLQMEKELLEQHGHTVLRFERRSSTIKSIWQKIKVFFSLPYSKETYDSFTSFCQSTKVDLIHVHNTFPLITPAVFYAAQDLGIPVVYTLHNYRLIYPNGLMLHKGRIDKRTIHGSAYRVVLDKVYQNSILKTFAVARLIERHKERNTWNTQVDQFIVLSPFMKEMFLEWGIEEQFLSYKPNFIQDPSRHPENKNQARTGFLFVGRLSEEKGIQNLIQTWIQKEIRIPLRVIGDGPLISKLQAQSRQNDFVRWEGFQNTQEIESALKTAKALIFPSLCFEGFPMTILEAFAVGTPVISTNIGSQGTIIVDGHNGLLFDPEQADDLKSQIMKIDGDSDLLNRLSTAAREDFENLYSSDNSYDQLMRVYQKATRISQTRKDQR